MKKTFTFEFFFVIALAIGCALPFTGCIASRIKPGRATTSADGITAQAVQSQDPKDPMTQNVTTSQSEERVIPAGSVVEAIQPGQTNAERITLSQPMPVKSATTKTIETKIGGAQKNMAQEIGAKLASLRWLTWLGVVVALFGVASLVYPPLKLIVASVTTSAACIASGVAMIFLPVLVVGHELLILCCSAGAAGIWFLAHRHGGLQGEVNYLRSLFANAPAKPAPASRTPIPGP